jgi:hypothetical protein
MKWSHNGRVYDLLKQIETERAEQANSLSAAANITWLLKYRAEFRWVRDFGLLEPIKLYLIDCPPDMIPVGVWLWGKCADRFRLYGLSTFCDHSSPQVRRHVAKALRRLEAWALLAEMGATYPNDAKIQWYAWAPTMHRPFTERLKNYTTNVDDSHAGEVATPSRMPYWALEHSWEGTPPKSVAFIRRMLHRIRHWVRWGTV